MKAPEPEVSKYYYYSYLFYVASSRVLAEHL